MSKLLTRKRSSHRPGRPSDTPSQPRTRRHGRLAIAAGALALLGSAFSSLPAGAVAPAAATARSASHAASPIHPASGAVAFTGQALLPGRSLVNGAYRLLLTLNGDLELRSHGALLWSSDTAGHHRARAFMQADGNLVLRTRAGTAFWSTHTAGHPGARLLMRRDGTVMVQGTSDRILWSKSKPTSVTGYAIAELSVYGWSSDQWSCLQPLWQRESGWNYRAENPSSGAYGIPQALPGSKMASEGSDWATNPETQIRWGLDYIKSRYGTPCGAWGHSESSGWY